MAAATRPMRADARRNRDAVLDAGAQLLTQRPTATMQDIADASGLGRATVYRHFPAREDLVGALFERVGEEVGDAVRQALSATDDGAEAVLRRLVAEAVALGHRWAFLDAVSEPRDAPDVAADVTAAFERWVAQAQARGELVAGDPAWIGAALRGLLEAGRETYAADPGAARRVVGDAVVALFVAR